MPALLRLLAKPNRLSSSSHLLNLSLRFRRPIATAPAEPPPPPPPPPPPNPSLRTRTPLEKQFEGWIDKLRPGFGPPEVADALRAQSDPDLALDIFRWAAQQRGYRHDAAAYLAMIKILISGRRYRHAETLVEEVVAGACEMSVPLYNSVIRFCCGRKFLFNRAFDVYKKMLRSEDCKPTLETYTLLFNSLLRRFNKLHVCYVYLHAVRSMAKQMKVSGVIPDTFVLNMIIKAYSKCLVVDDAIRVFREMGLYGCEPNAYTYSYIVKGLCEKGRVGQGLGFYKEMRSKGLVPKSSAYMILICSLSMERRFEEATEAVFDMLREAMAPDLLTYKTLLEGLCREGKGSEAFDLLEEFRKMDTMMGQKNHKILLNGINFITRE
ncbi:pentatricopeptide repeat-containing protein At3g25210, mitochondrial [Eucalyptus grandis]|uniref:pentatricopeptide repeat-containing protein At3g25210, mitochondrial n=1 Tax=Eucalyptus grandis TaxID=71139 RepID=UPI00192EB0A6|nr:pentatricopeptide repeat-containing protein At3g25210, mitochondrial [Eucalyptus grandis]